MSMFPGRPASRAVELYTIDATHQSSSAKANAAGAATVTFGPPNGGLIWDVSKIVVQTSDGLGTAALVYVGDNANKLNLTGGTSVPGLDFDDEAALLVLDNEVLSVVFAGLTPGAVAGVRIQLDVKAKVPAR